jgi:hypothetical protein
MLRISALHDVETRTINYHLKKVFADCELKENSVIREFPITAMILRVPEQEDIKGKSTLRCNCSLSGRFTVDAR